MLESGVGIFRGKENTEKFVLLRSQEVGTRAPYTYSMDASWNLVLALERRPRAGERKKVSGAEERRVQAHPVPDLIAPASHCTPEMVHERS